MFGKFLKHFVPVAAIAAMLFGGLTIAPQQAEADYNPAPSICFDENLLPTSLHFDLKDGTSFFKMTLEDLVVKEGKGKAAYGNNWGITFLGYNDTATGNIFDQSKLTTAQLDEIGKLLKGKEAQSVTVEVSVPSGSDFELHFNVDTADSVKRGDAQIDATIQSRMRSGRPSSGYKTVAGNTRCLIDDDSDNMQVRLETRSGAQMSIDIDEGGSDSWKTKYDPAVLKISATGTAKPNVECRLNNTITCNQTTGACSGGAEKTCGDKEVCVATKGCTSITPSTSQATVTPAAGTNSNINVTGDTRAVTSKDITIANPLGTASPQNLIVRIINWLIGIAGTVAILMIILGGFRYITSAGNPENTKKAVTILRNAIIGLVIVILSFLIVQTVTNLLGSGSGGTSTGTGTTTNTNAATATKAPTAAPAAATITAAQKQNLNQICSSGCTNGGTRACNELNCSSVKNCKWVQKAGSGGTCETTITDTDQAKSAITTNNTPSGLTTAGATNATCDADCKKLGPGGKCDDATCKTKALGGNKCHLDINLNSCVTNTTYCGQSCSFRASGGACTKLFCDEAIANGGPCAWDPVGSACIGK